MKNKPSLLSGGTRTMNVAVRIPPQSCSTGGVARLTEINDLPPGEYTVHPSAQTTCGIGECAHRLTWGPSIEMLAAI
jgi:hypothetical protein